jgi:DNA polymerase I
LEKHGNDQEPVKTGGTRARAPGKFVDRLLIIDGHGYAYRAFHAIRSLDSPDGRPTNAIFGFVKMLAKIRAAIQPSHVAVVWDGGLSAERAARWPEYKAQRPPMPEALRPQFDEIVDYLKAAGVASFCYEGVEADDYIAGLARRAVAAGMTVVIASADKDFMQLVSERVGLLNPNDKDGTIWTAAQVRAKTGVEPSQIVDWLSLTGDAVDNIPGVAGVGPKTAAGLLNQFGSVSGVYGRLAEVKPERLRAAVRDAADAVQRNRELVRLQDDLPRELSPEALVAKPADTGRLRGLYQRWGFKGMLAALEETPRERQAILI